jgi:hypothetical protein
LRVLEEKKMNNRILIFIIILVIFGAVVIIQQQKSMNQVEQMERQAIEKVHEAEVEQAKQMALEAVQHVETRTQEVLQNALSEVKRVGEEAREKAEGLKAKIVGLVAQAQSLLDGGQFQQAIDLANTILGEDPGNMQAQSIIKQATAKLQEAAQRQSEAIAAETGNMLEEAGSAFPGPGQ